MGSRVEPLAGGWGQRPRIAEQSSAAAQINRPIQKSRHQAKNNNPKKPPHEKPQKCSYKPICANKTEPTTCGGFTYQTAPSRAAATAAVTAG